MINGEEIITTVDHPFYVNDRGFVNAGELAVGDELLDSNKNILDEESLGFQSVGCQTNQKNDYCIFYTNTPEEEIEIRRDSIISVDKAFEAAKKFFYKREMPDNIEWTEN